jgi:choloylglycine hydrolase
VFHSYGENIIFIPRQYKIQFKKSKSIDNHYSILGIGIYYDNYPFLFDAINEKGIGVSCLNFVGNAEYYDFKDNKINLAPYELILYLLSECSSLDEVKRELININLINVSYDSNMPISQLHFMVSSQEGSIVIESTKKGLIIYDNFLNVLTNNPEFSYHINNVSQYLNLSLDNPEGYISLGQGLFGLPGDYSSISRLIRAYFIKTYILIEDMSKNDNINQFFYVLDSVLMPKGLVKEKNRFEYTLYSVCYDLENFMLYYKTYNDRKIKEFKINSNESVISIFKI